MNTLTLVLALLLLLSLTYVLPADPLRVLAYVFMGLALSSISTLTYYRRLEFLAAEAVHVSLLAVTLGTLLEYYTGLTYMAYAVITGLLPVYATAIMIRRGFSQEKASAVIVSLTSALSVITIHYALTSAPVRYSLSGLILGDPLLLTRVDAVTALAISLGLFIVVTLTFQEVVETSIDAESASLLGIRVRLYDFVAYTAIGVASVGLLKLAGYVMEHVLLLLPAITASSYSTGVKAHYMNTVLLGTSLTALGYALSYVLNTAPTGLTGILLFVVLVIGHVKRGV
ncbi:MAG: metal ABC transporter permease [Desulfurococcaceae archaeon]